MKTKKTAVTNGTPKRAQDLVLKVGNAYQDGNGVHANLQRVGYMKPMQDPSKGFQIYLTGSVVMRHNELDGTIRPAPISAFYQDAEKPAVAKEANDTPFGGDKNG